MSKYTITVYELLKSGFDIGLRDYEIFDESYREILNNSIINFYRFREIGFDNPILWKERLNFRLDLIMRNKYNDLYKARMLEFNPLYNIDITETYEREVKGNASATSKGNSSTNDKSKQYTSTYPNDDIKGDLENFEFVDSGAHGESNNNTYSTGSDSSESNGSESWVRTEKGSSAGLPFSKALLQLKEFYDSYNLDQQIINELSDLFINIW